MRKVAGTPSPERDDGPGRNGAVSLSAAVPTHTDAGLARWDMVTITKKELVDRIATKFACKRAMVKRIIGLFLDQLTDELGQGNRIELREFGVFESKIRAARTAQNPKTLERVTVGVRRRIKFKLGRVMKLRLQNLPPT